MSSIGLARVVKPHLENFDGEVGLYVRHLQSGEEFGHQADVDFLTASVFKIPVLVELFRQVDSGLRSFESQVRIS
jgi:beta-lactamase class A